MDSSQELMRYGGPNLPYSSLCRGGFGPSYLDIGDSSDRLTAKLNCREPICPSLGSYHMDSSQELMRYGCPDLLYTSLCRGGFGPSYLDIEGSSDRVHPETQL